MSRSGPCTPTTRLYRLKPRFKPLASPSNRAASDPSPAFAGAALPEKDGVIVNSPPSPDALEISPGFARANLEGWVPELAGEDELRTALDKALDFRGDVTIMRKDGSKIEGYIFDRR